MAPNVFKQHFKVLNRRLLQKRRCFALRPEELGRGAGRQSVGNRTTWAGLVHECRGPSSQVRKRQIVSRAPNRVIFDSCCCTDISLSCARLPPFQPYWPRPNATSAGAPTAHRLGPMGLFHMKCSGTVYPDSIVLECKSHTFEGKNCCHRELQRPMLCFVAFAPELIAQEARTEQAELSVSLSPAAMWEAV